MPGGEPGGDVSDVVAIGTEPAIESWLAAAEADGGSEDVAPGSQVMPS